MYEYGRDVFYYETDKMGVVHHSNFVRWLEEARVAFFDDVGLPYTETEARGLFAPVISIGIRYKAFARFGDRFSVRLRMTRYTGVRFELEYEVYNGSGALLAEGQSAHAFVGEDFKPAPLSRAMREKHALMKENVEK